MLRTPVTPFDRRKTKNANCFEECNVFGNEKCELNAIQEGRKRCKFLARKSAKLLANSKVHIFGKEKCKTYRNLSATKVTSLPSLSLSLCLSVSLSLSHLMHLTHNIGSTSTLPIIKVHHRVSVQDFSGQKLRKKEKSS